jgi:succinyl-CoA:acetate CoA-transferase
MARISRRIQGDVTQLSPENASELIPSDATIAVSGFGSVGYPKAIPQALAESGRDLSLTIASGGSVGGEIDTDLVEAEAIERRFPYVATPEAREAINDDRISFHDRHISSFGAEVTSGKLADVDVTIVEAIEVGEDWLIPSTSIGHTPSFVTCADRLFIEVNEAQPRALSKFHDVTSVPDPPRPPLGITDPADRIGNARIPFDDKKLEGVVSVRQPDSPYEFRPPTDTDKQIARHLKDFLEGEINRSTLYSETVCLQFGVGSLGNALMGEVSSIEFGDGRLIYFGEVIQDGLLDLLSHGELAVASATSLALSDEGQTRLFSNIDEYVEDIVLRPANISNSPELISRFGVVAVNSAIEVDIYGHVNSTHVKGSGLLSGIGGSADFNRNGALSITALPSTAKGGDLSRIVPMVTHVDHTEHDVDVIITEQGVADLRGCSPSERQACLIEECVHPSFVSDLEAYVEQARKEEGHIPHALDKAFSWTV